jgi:hypothetical protein
MDMYFIDKQHMERWSEARGDVCVRACARRAAKRSRGRGGQLIDSVPEIILIQSMNLDEQHHYMDNEYHQVSLQMGGPVPSQLYGDAFQ